MDTSNTPAGTMLKLIDTQALNQMSAEPAERFAEMATKFSQAAAGAETLMKGASMQGQTISRTHTERLRGQFSDLAQMAESLSGAGSNLAGMYAAYVQDASRRMLLTLDVLRERADIFLEHEAAGCPPVLVYDYEIIVDGKDLERPCNYQLLRILPKPGMQIDDASRPYIIIDPRAGHGGGIGGFKNDSQVGVALKQGHPVYFVNFVKDPVPGQTLADVTRAEAEFVREVQRRHPDSPKPVVFGNCQGGWATLLLAATNPDLTGPIVLNGAPVQPWGGEVGKNPMRYNAGVLGGTYMPMILSDLGGGQLDGANLVMNFELLNPSRNYFTKYYDVFENPEGARQRFLDFERWWGGFFILNEAEIRWIVEQLFVGNKLVKNQAQLEPGRTIDLKAIKAPTIVFASHGDNITPPQQALNWIVDTYADDHEIKIRGNRIIYMVHEAVGHLGIFVSAKIARKETANVASVMETIEALPPGLYEMLIENVEGEGQDMEFTVSFAERGLDDLRAIDDGREEEAGFAAVQRLSEIQAEAYELLVRPMIQAAVTPAVAEANRKLHPMRTSRSMFASSNPMMGMLQSMLPQMGERTPLDPSNPFLMAERLFVKSTEQMMDLMRDTRDMMYEAMFMAMWMNPAAIAFGKKNAVGRTLKTGAEVRGLPEVQMALANIDKGGLVEAVIRVLVMMADGRGDVRSDRLERSAALMTQDEPFASLGTDAKAHIIKEQTLIATFEPERAIETLPQLLTTKAEREKAAAVMQYVPGKIDEMAPATRELLQKVRKTLGLPEMKDDMTENPLRPGPKGGAAKTEAAE